MFKALALSALCVSGTAALPHAQLELLARAPKLAALLQRASTPEGAAQLAMDIRKEFPAYMAQPVAQMPAFNHAAASSPQAPLPIVVAHGMGDSCFNAGMKSITQAAGNKVGAYATCIPTGNNEIEDTINGFILNMDKSVDVFATKVRADPKLANGFNAFGLSQGNNLINGYIRKYNNPKVNTFMSICGINAGVGAFPECDPDTIVVGGVCEALSEVLGDLAYLEVVQDVLFQANYFRDPVKLNDTQYLTNSQLAAWNNEGKSVGKYNATYKTNFIATDKYVWVKGNQDTVVWPREGEWWGAVKPAQWKLIDAMNNTRWYTEDLFGLQTVDKAGKNHFESFNGEHIRFTDAELYAWLTKYFA